MPIQNRSLSPGTLLVATYKKERYECLVEEKDGKAVFILPDGRRLKSASAAASAVMGGKAANGWLFWSLAEEPEGKKLLQTPAAPSKLIRRQPNQQGLEAGKTRYWCNGCMKSFIAEAGELPEKCPAGHAEEREVQ